MFCGRTIDLGDSAVRRNEPKKRAEVAIEEIEGENLKSGGRFLFAFIDFRSYG